MNIEKLLENAKFNLSNEEREIFKKDYSIFLKEIDLLNKVDLDQYERLVRPLSNKNNSNVMRDDKIIFNNPWRVKEQSSLTEDKYICLKEIK